MMPMQVNGIDRSAYYLVEEREDFKRRGGDVEDGAFGEDLLLFLVLILMNLL